MEFALTVGGLHFSFSVYNDIEEDLLELITIGHCMREVWIELGDNFDVASFELIGAKG